MSGAMRKMGVYLGLVEDDVDGDGRRVHDEPARGRGADREAARRDRYDYDDDADYAADEREPQRTTARRSHIEAVEDIPETPRIAPRAEEPVARPSHHITTLHPRTYNEARAIGDEFRGGNPVIMNLTEMDDADAKRLVDFAAGLTFALRGSIERITTKVFLLSPQKVKVSTEQKARIADGDYPSHG